jgi:gluconolactonase
VRRTWALLGKILVPETVSNAALAGSRRNQLFITATTSLYTIHTGLRAPRVGTGARKPD